MDNLTHTLTGLMLSRAGLNRWCPRATPILLLASNAPDIDIVTRWGGSLTYLDQHRGVTHALLFLPVLAAIVSLGVHFLGRKFFGKKPVPYFRGVVTAAIGILCHVLMDYTNVYGIRLLLPFSDAMPRLDMTNVVDIWMWIVLLLAVAGPLLSGLVSSEIGARRSTGRGAAVFALLFLLIYSAGRFVLHGRAVSTVSAHLYEGRTPLRVEAYPHFANPFAWNTLVDTGDAFILQRISLLEDYDPTGGKLYYQATHAQALAAARATATVQRYLRFAQVVYWRATPVEKPEGGLRVEACDLRFGEPTPPRFVATVILDPALRVVSETFSFGMGKP